MARLITYSPSPSQHCTVSLLILAELARGHERCRDLKQIIYFCPFGGLKPWTILLTVQQSGHYATAQRGTYWCTHAHLLLVSVGCYVCTLHQLLNLLM